MNARFFALDRFEDVSGVSRTGRVAYAIDVGPGVLLVWDTDLFINTDHEQGNTVDWRPSMAAVERIHGHGGKTRITSLTDDPPARDHALALLRRVMPPAVSTYAAALRLVIGDGPDSAPVAA